MIRGGLVAPDYCHPAREFVSMVKTFPAQPAANSFL